MARIVLTQARACVGRSAAQRIAQWMQATHGIVQFRDDAVVARCDLDGGFVTLHLADLRAKPGVTKSAAPDRTPAESNLARAGGGTALDWRWRGEPRGGGRRAEGGGSLSNCWMRSPTLTCHARTSHSYGHGACNKARPDERNSSDGGRASTHLDAFADISKEKRDDFAVRRWRGVEGTWQL